MERSMLKVLMISSDSQILVSGSLVEARMRGYGALVGQLHIVVLSHKASKLESHQLAPNVWACPTNSISKIARPIDAMGLGSEILEKNNFKTGESLITTQDPFECGWVGLRLKKKFNIPLEVQLHTDPFSNNFAGPLNFIRKIIARVVLPHADGIRVVLKSIGESLQKKFSIDPKKIRVLPIFIDRNGTEDAELDLHNKHGWETIVLSASRLEPEKNLDLVIKGFKDVVEKFPHAGLVIAGSGSQENKLKQLTVTLGIEKNVIFVGWQKDLKPFYKSADIYVQASKFEGYGLSLVEAGLMGLSVISTSVGIAKELKDGEEILIVEENPTSIFQALTKLTEDKNLREKLGTNLKGSLGSKILSKESYLSELKKNWENTAKV